MPKKGTKKGVDQRVKGNAKTASSGRTAEMMGGEGRGFIGFEAVSGGMKKGSGEGVAMGGAGEEVSHGAGVGFQVVMKQLGKRDTTTKLKALQEFSTLCEQEPQESVVAILNLWPLMYNKLSVDNDNRVREACHKALRACVQKVKGGIAPQLRSILGCWVAGMCDPHGPAASAALSAFTTAFTLTKQREVFKFGLKAVVGHAEDVILRENVDTFSDPRVTPTDERVQRYERAVVMAVYGLGLTLQQLPVEHLVETKATWEPFLGEKRLWKLARHQNPFIRASVFSLVTTVCTQIEDFVKSRGKQFCSLVLSSLGESEPVVISPLWEATLLIVTKIESWSHHVNIQKGLLPGLWSLLSSGGYGSAKVTYPCLLPLLSKLVEQVFRSDLKFAKSFLEKLRNGLQADRVRTSPVECEVVMQTYTECFLYLLLHISPSEKQKDDFYSGLLGRVVDLAEFSVTECPSRQCEVVYSAVVRLAEGLLSAQEKNPWLRPYIAELKENLTGRMVVLVQGGAKNKANFSRIGNLLITFHKDHKNALSERKTVKFTESSAPSHRSEERRTSTTEAEEAKPVVQFVHPTVCSLCVNCITEVCGFASLQHCELLCTLLRQYGNSSLVKAVCGHLEAGYSHLLRHGDNSGGREGNKLLVLCSSLLRAANLDNLSQSSESIQLTESVMESVVLLLYCDLVESRSAALFLSELAKQHPTILPLVLLKLDGGGHKEGIKLILSSCQERLLSLLDFTEREEGGSTFLWELLELILTKPISWMEVVGAVFERVSELLSSTFQQSEGELDTATLRRLLQIMAKLDAQAVPESEDDVTKLLSSLLHGCLHSSVSEGLPKVLDLLPEVCTCYSHLLSALPDPLLYLQSVSSFVTSALEEEENIHLQRTLQSAVILYILHHEVMDTVHSFWSVHQSIVAAASSLDEMFIPLSGLDLFCKGSLLYAPFFEDMASDSVSGTLSPSLQLALFPAVALCDPKLLREIPFLSLETPGLEPPPHTVASILSTLESNVDLKVVLSSEEEPVTLAKKWKQLVTLLTLAITSLQTNTQSALEKRVGSILQSALERSLQTALCDMERLRSLLSGLMDRAAMCPLWCLVLQQLLSSLEKTVGREVIGELVSVILKEPEAGALQAALSGLSDPAIYKTQILSLVEENENDVCLLVACLHLLPDCDELLSVGAKLITDIATKHGKSELTLFESAEDCCQDPFAFSVLELMGGLVQAQRVPSEAWDFVLCSLVTLTQLLADAGEQAMVNHTVLYCRALELCCTVGQFLCSPFAQSHQATEWAEFFQPALQDCLLPLFIRGADSQSLISDSCLRYQQHHLSRAAATLCINPQNASLEELVQKILSPFYPHQAASFLLAKRLLGSLQIILDDSPTALNAKKPPITLSVIQGALGKALEQVDLDLVFLEEGPASGYHNTTAYILLWMVVVATMSHCDPETRGAMGEWLKELSLFDHLLHGLFKFLGDVPTVAKRTEVEVVLSPSLVQLASTAYCSVARQLPSMLRQWFLSLDRQTSTMVNKFTTKHVSPVLQQTELETVGKSNTTVGNMEVRVCVGASEVSVVYRLDEFSIELFVCLPDNYPLQPPAIREGRRVRMDPAQWRKWMLQLNVFVANQNGSLLDGLLLWKSNLDRHFAGVEDCMICFSVIHSSNCSLPKMICKTCKKKFHSACLYKWFSTSTKSTCPLCRNIF